MNWAIIKEPTLIVTAVVYGVLAFICVSAGMFGIWLGVLLLLSFYRYGYSVLLKVAQGYQRIPPPDLDSFNPVGQWGVVFHFVAFPGLVIATAPFQPAGLVIAILVACAFPASAAVMAVTNSLADAFNPSAWAKFIRIIGRDYSSLVIGSLFIVLGATLLQGLLLSSPGIITVTLSFSVMFWATFAIFALVGSVMRTHRLKFEIPGELVPAEDRELKERHEEWRKDLDIAYASFRSGLISAGYHTLHTLVDANDDSVEVNFWLVENMLEWEDIKYALEVAAKLMPRLLASGNEAEALTLYHRLRRRQPDFRPPPAQAEELAAHAMACGQTGVANELGYNPDSTATS